MIGYHFLIQDLDNRDNVLCSEVKKDFGGYVNDQVAAQIATEIAENNGIKRCEIHIYGVDSEDIAAPIMGEPVWTEFEE